MKKNMLSILLIVCLLVALLFYIAGCGKEPEQEDGLITVTITALDDHYGLRFYAREYERANPNVKVVVNRPISAIFDGLFAPESFTDYSRHLEMGLMSNTGDDILCLNTIDYYKYADSGLLMDFYSLIKDDPDFDGDNYFMNVIEAFEYKGGLYVFPLNFEFQLMGVNLHVNSELVNAYKQYDKISTRDLLDLYQRFNPGQYSLGYMLTPPLLLLTEMDSFVDREKATCDFTNQRFLDLLNDSRMATAKDQDWRSGFVYAVWSLEDETELAKKYMFQPAYSINLQYIIPQREDKNFTHFIPLVSDDGKATIGSLSPPTQLAISKGSKHKEAAWEFIKYLIRAREFVYDSSNSIYINKSTTEKLYATNIQSCYYRPDLSESGLVFAEDREYALKAGMEKIMGTSSMPMRFPGSKVMYYSDEEYWSIFEQCRLNVMSAEQVASWLQNRTEIRLKE